MSCLDYANSLLQTGVFAKPEYYDAVKKFPPMGNKFPSKKARAPKPVYIEDRMVKVMLRRRPILKLEWSETTDYTHVPIRQKFVEQQLKLMKEENLSEEDAYWRVDEILDDEIAQFEQELVDQKGDIILNARRNTMQFVQEREKFLSTKRDEFHAKKFLTPRKMNVAETAETNLRYLYGDEPIHVYGTATKRKKAADFSFNDLDKKTRSFMEEVNAGCKVLNIYEGNPVWDDC